MSDPTNQTTAGSSAAPCSALGELLENLEDWGQYFRVNEHAAALTIFRAKKTIADQAARIGELLSAVNSLSQNTQPTGRFPDFEPK